MVSEQRTHINLDDIESGILAISGRWAVASPTLAMLPGPLADIVFGAVFACSCSNSGTKSGSSAEVDFEGVFRKMSFERCLRTYKS